MVKAKETRRRNKSCISKIYQNNLGRHGQQTNHDFPIFDKMFYLETDGSLEGYGAFLFQMENQDKQIIAYASTNSKPSHVNYGAAKLEATAAVWAMKHFKHYLQNRQFVLRTDNAVMKYIGKHGGALEKWAIDAQ